MCILGIGGGTLRLVRMRRSRVWEGSLEGCAFEDLLCACADASVKEGRDFYKVESDNYAFLSSRSCHREDP
eukprot:scaffold209601_cov33-Tisochrysis_lutea.AAC.2